MKISPLGGGLGSVATASPTVPSVRTVQFKTNVSPERFDKEAETAPQESATPDATGQATEVTEETKPLSPQFAALARQRRALQLEKQALEKLKAETQAKTANGVTPEQIKADPLGVILSSGVTWDDLTQAVLKHQSVDPKVAALEAKLAALETGVEQKLTERDTQARQQVLAEMKRDALALASAGDEYEMVRETGSVPLVLQLIERTFDEKGEILDVAEAMKLVEDELVTETLKVANLKKVQSQLAPPLAPQPQPQTRPGMRTLTNRDTARAVMSAKARAIAAFNGTLKR